MSTVIRSKLSRKNRFYIDKNRYYELKYFCLQYDDWKRALTDIQNTIRTLPEVYVQQSTVADVTAKMADARMYYQNRIDLIENAAKETSSDFWKYLVQAVTKGYTYNALDIPCCREVYYEMYREFFWRLSMTRN